MNKQDIYNLIKKKEIWYEITEHDAIFTMEGLSQVEMPYPKRIAKNLFIRDDKKENYYLITVKEDKRVNLKKFKEEHNTRHLSFASEEDLMNILNLIKGSVTPFGLLNDKDLKVKFFIDKDFWEDNKIIGIHPNDNTATVWLKIDDLINIIKEHGNIVNILKV